MNKTHIALIGAIALTLELTGCASQSPIMKVGDIQPQKVAVNPNQKMPSITAKQVRDQLRAYIEVAQNESMKQKASLRLAALETEAGEDKLISGDAPSKAAKKLAKKEAEYFEFAIKAYNKQLKENPKARGNEDILYQLARAYELNGQDDKSLEALDKLVKQYPNSPYNQEAQFRRGELMFGLGFFEDAEKAYRYVLDTSPKSKYYRHSEYMLGWSQFKLGEYTTSIAHFSRLVVKIMGGASDMSGLPKAQEQMLDDILRVMSIAASYEKGPSSLKGFFDAIADKPYEFTLFEHIANHFHKKERYKDTADTYLAYINRNPNDSQAPFLYIRLIENYEEGEFPQYALKQKEGFIERYGAESEFWKKQPLDIQNKLRANLMAYSEQAAEHYHATAQIPDYEVEERLALNLKAAGYYRHYLAVSQGGQDHKRDIEMTFLMAESLFDGKAHDKAAEAYETVAYTPSQFKKRKQAAHGAILSYNALIFAIDQKAKSKDKKAKALSEEQQTAKNSWVEARAQSALKYKDTFAKDANAVAALSQVATDYYNQKSYESAIAMATLIVDWPIAKKDQKEKARLILAHSYFELKQYPEAEAAYLGLAKNSKGLEKKEHLTQAAAAIYKQGEAANTAKDLEGATEHFLRIAKVAPKTDIAITGQYDAASLLIAMTQWDIAIDVLKAFRKDNPRHKLTKDIPAKLLTALEEAERWEEAADELYLLAKRAKDVNTKRDATYQAATYIEKTGKVGKTIQAYKEYVYTYPQPLEVAEEARFKMASLYDEQNEQSKREYWLKEIIEANDKAGKNATPRTRYLAAGAQLVFADKEFDKYQDIKLRLPLKKSMKKKQKALKKVLKGYEKVASYQVAEYATAANFKVAEVYLQLSKDIMNSQRPKKLSALEKEQYTILLEEQAMPFEEKALELHENNTARIATGTYDKWVKKSFKELARLNPAKYEREEKETEIVNEIM